MPSMAGTAADPWRYGGFVDLGYAVNFNVPENHRWRSKETTPRTNELAPNMLLGYLHKEPRTESRWGVELALQGGYDTDALVPDPKPGRDRPIPGADVLRHISRANIEYLTPIGKGLTLTAGLMEGYINYESFYAKDNFNYTRAYITDFSPNFVMGMGARYPFSSNVDFGFHVMNGYNHLAHANNQASYGAELDWRFAKRAVLAQNLYVGPDQADTSVKFWRFFSDTQVRWRGDQLTVALAYDIGTEKAADLPNAPQTFWMGGALFTRWELTGPWSVAVRPEFYWDRNGRLSEFEQFIWANTTTIEYRRHLGRHQAVIRLEHRYDHSGGPEGGFFRRSRTSERDPELSQGQHLLLVSVVWAIDR
jgi:hypothetical protein